MEGGGERRPSAALNLDRATSSVYAWEGAGAPPRGEKFRDDVKRGIHRPEPIVVSWREACMQLKCYESIGMLARRVYNALSY